MFVSMSRFINRKSIAFVLVALALLASVLGAVAIRGSASHASAPKAHPQTAAADKHSFCSQLGKTSQASSGAQMFCFGPQPKGNGASAGNSNKHKKNTFGSNSDAATPAEDVAPNGTQAYGQSETSVA